VYVINSDGTQGVIGTTNNNSDPYIVKFNTDGISQWISIYEGSSVEAAYGVLADSSGNVFLVGTSRGPTFDGGSEAFLRKYNTNGNVIWTSHAASAWPASTIYHGITTDVSGNVYAIGKYRKSDGVTTLINPDSSSFATLSATDAGGQAFLVKHNSSGVIQWVSRIASAAADIGYGVATDSVGNVYITGDAGASGTTFNSSNGATFTTMTSIGASEAFIVKYNTSGIIQWVTKVASVGADAGYAIVVDSEDSIYVAGQGGNGGALTAYSEGNTPFSTTIPNTSSADGFLVKYNSSGAVQWVTRVAGSLYEVGVGLTTHISGRIYMVGHFQSNPLTVYNA
jgi:hypothetical protein